MVEKVRFLKECGSQEFVWATIQLAKERKFTQNEIIYQRGDIGDTFFMIFEGRVTLQATTSSPSSSTPTASSWATATRCSS